MKPLLTILLVAISFLCKSQRVLCGKTSMDSDITNNVYNGNSLQSVQNVMLDMSHSFWYNCDSAANPLTWDDTLSRTKDIASNYYVDSSVANIISDSGIASGYGIKIQATKPRVIMVDTTSGTGTAKIA